MKKEVRSGVNQRYGDPDPHQNVTDLQHFFRTFMYCVDIAEEAWNGSGLSSVVLYLVPVDTGEVGMVSHILRALCPGTQPVLWIHLHK